MPSQNFAPASLNIEPNVAAALASSHSIPGSLTLPDAAIATPMSLAQSRYVKTVEGKSTWTKTRKQPQGILHAGVAGQKKAYACGICGVKPVKTTDAQRTYAGV